MPRIPVYDAPQVESRALPGVRESSVASPSLFGAGAEQQAAAGRGMIAAGTGLSNAAAVAQDRENADMVFRVDGALKREYIDYEQEVRKSRQGRFAAGLVDDTDKWFAEQEKKHGGALANDVQRHLFSQRLQSLRLSALNSIGQYQDTQLEKSHDEGWAADKNATISLAADDPSKIDSAVGELGRLNKYQAARKGWEPSVIEAETLKDTTALHVEVLKGMADSNPSAAREYLAKYDKQIDGRKKDDIERVLKVGETKQAGFLFAERPDIQGLATDQDRIAAARDFFKDDPEKRDAAIHEIKTRSAENTQFRERAQRDAADAAWGAYGRSGRLSDVPASVLASMDGRDYAALKEHAANKAAGKGVATDMGTYLDLRDMVRDDPEGFRKVDLRRYIGKLSKEDIEEFAKLQTKPQELKDAATLSQQLSNMNLGLGKDQERVFHKVVADAVNAEQQSRGKSLNYNERQAIIDRMAIEGDVNGWWLGGGRRLYEVQGKSEAAKFVPKITDEDRQTIIDRYQQRVGRKPTDTELMQTFKKWKGL